MVESHTFLDTIYTGWEDCQGRLIKAVAPLSPDQLALRAAPQLRSLGEIAGHIARGRARWLHYALGEGTETTAPILARPAAGAPAATAAELVSGLEATWADLAAARARWTLPTMAQPFTIMLDGEERTLTRQWVLWHLLEHDLHHGGELALCLGMHGLTAPKL
jgi:uncharacterized damage-inducible protein DinB